MEHLPSLFDLASLFFVIVFTSIAFFAFLQGRVGRAFAYVVLTGAVLLGFYFAKRLSTSVADSLVDAASTVEAPALPDTPVPTPAPPVEFNSTLLLRPAAAILLVFLIYLAIRAVVRKHRAREEAATAWTVVRKKFNAAQATIGHHETDLDLQITQPAFNDVNEPATAEMIGAYRTATTLMDSTRKDHKIGGTPALLKEVQAAVSDLTQKVAAAEDNARARGMFWRSDAECALLEDIQALLNQARHGTDTMRLAAYRQVQKKAAALNRVIGATVVRPHAVELEVEGSGLLALTAS